ncbi:anti sigma factor C-terminal domain-containing protein [Chungangia koreensis]|uniref:Anti sigma factor C-terminal domain-containing protein n=1 Tax=Chungangia koreensis TaxID=752657 RepID=A0ABV8X926_9LACT
MDSYDKLINDAKKETLEPKNGVRNVKKAITSSKWRMVLMTITVALLIVPTCYMMTFFYYAFGTKSTTLMDITSHTLYITEPNTTLEELEFDMDFSLFSMDLGFQQYKQIGGEVYPAKTYDLKFVLNDLVNKEIDSKLEKVYPKNPTQTNQWLVHPNNQMEFFSEREWRVLSGLPDETVVEAYLSLSKLYSVDEVEKAMNNVDVTWAAIYTGVEDDLISANGELVSPIGYPVQPDNTYWSPFRGSRSHEETFLDMLKGLVPYEPIAEEISPHKNLELPERINYIENNGFQTYGVVVTGPKNEIEALQGSDMIRAMKVGEVKLWNWNR